MPGLQGNTLTRRAEDVELVNENNDQDIFMMNAMVLEWPRLWAELGEILGYTPWVDYTLTRSHT